MHSIYTYIHVSSRMCQNADEIVCAHHRIRTPWAVVLQGFHAASITKCKGLIGKKRAKDRVPSLHYP